MSRDFLTVKIWDLAAVRTGKTGTGRSGKHHGCESEAIRTIPIHDYIKPSLSTLYDADAIFDRFSMDISPDGQHVLTGSYANQFSIFNTNDGGLTHKCDISSTVKRDINKDTRQLRSQSTSSVSIERLREIDIQRKVLLVL